MGARGKVKELGEPIPLRLPPKAEARARMQAKLEGVPLAVYLRRFVVDGLRIQVEAERMTAQVHQALGHLKQTIDGSLGKPSETKKEDR